MINIQQYGAITAGLVLLTLSALLAGCGSGAVMFAPTPAPPDLSPVRYTHPSGAFSLLVPPNWSVHEQNRTDLAVASFAPPNADQPLLMLAVIQPALDVTAESLEDVVQQYQTQVRPDVERYKESDRQPMGDGSWRMTGLRLTPTGATQQVNTFVTFEAPLLGVIDVVLPEDVAIRADVERAINTFSLSREGVLQGASLSTLNGASATSLSALHVSTWSTPEGVFFITGEVANYGTAPVAGVPVRARLVTADGRVLAEASDRVMGYGIRPGEFAPFSLRFGQGQPAEAVAYELVLGGEAWEPGTAPPFVGTEGLSWTDESSRDAEGRLLIQGTVTNTSGETIRNARAVITIFDTAQNVVAAGYVPVDENRLDPGDSASFGMIVAEMGGQPANYIVVVQGQA